MDSVLEEKCLTVVVIPSRGGGGLERVLTNELAFP
jgi:hypothetical protein